MDGASLRTMRFEWLLEQRIGIGIRNKKIKISKLETIEEIIRSILTWEVRVVCYLDDCFPIFINHPFRTAVCSRKGWHGAPGTRART